MRAYGVAWWIVLVSVLSSSPLQSQVCVGDGVGFAAGSGTDDRPANCVGIFFCYEPQLMGVQYETVGGCDPEAGACSVRARVPGLFPSARKNTLGIGFFDSPVKLIWTDSSGLVGTCGNAGARIQVDQGDTWITGGNFSCADPGAMTGAGEYTLEAVICDGVSGCEETRSVPVPFTPELLAAQLCDPAPPMNCDAGDRDCETCLGGGGTGGASAGGGGPGMGAPGMGPGAELVYQAGGTGNPQLPRPADWPLGAGWSHDYAERIVRDQAGSDLVVWLLTRWATFRRFSDTDMDGSYEVASPSDEYRTLTKTVAGWELRDLDGTVDIFDADGRWLSRTDRNGNAKVATYDASNRLARVDFPDGRQEDFTYDGSGRLIGITEIGVGATASRSWTYVWSGEELTDVDRPDGTSYRFEYSDMRYPGFMTKLVLIGSDGVSERILRGFAYDGEGNVEAMWQGADTPGDVAAVDVWELAYDDPASPTETTVTDPLGNDSIYAIGRDTASTKPRLESLSDSCPVCGLGPNSQLFYQDQLHPLRVTQKTDGDGTITRFAYDANGQIISRIEDFNGPNERETLYAYEPGFPAFVAERREPSVTGNPLDEKITTALFDGNGNATSRAVSGFEAGASFDLATVTAYSAEGMPTVIDPPGYGTADLTILAYADASRGNLLLTSRTDPLIGTSSFTYDAFNRRSSATDPNGLVVETTYDMLDRVLTIAQRGAVPAEDLVTQHVYNGFGDLFQTILPEGNVVEYGYDQAGRLVSVERKPDTAAASHGERTLYTLNGFGHRVREDLQRWDGAGWVSDAATAFEYSTRCYLDRTIEGVGSLTESITEFEFDCDGNLSRIWDANHPSAGRTQAATTVYAYDSLDRLTTVTQPWSGAGGGNVVTSYGYDVQDHLVEVIDGEGNVTSYSYSDRDLLTEEISEVTGTTSHVYNAHGELTETTDARGVTVTRTIDALDRVTFVDYPGSTLDIARTYDDPAVPFSLGRLTRIERDGHDIELAYDRFGRLIQDGALSFVFDKNGNRTQVTYPGGIAATYAYDFADRQSSLEVALQGQAAQSIVTTASYYPSGPLRTLSLGNGLAEDRAHDSRYHPTGITVSGAGTLLDWDYTTDGVGNPTGISDTLNTVNNRTYGYQDIQYFLTQGDGPWGARAWTYDRIGNRLTATSNGQPADVYQYLVNGAGGNTPKLSSITLGTGGTRSYVYDAAGNATDITQGSETLEREYDDASRLALIRRPEDFETTFAYDGRDFLRQAERTSLAFFADGFESGNAACWSSVVGGPTGGTCPAMSPPTDLSFPQLDSSGVIHGLDTASTTRTVLYFNGLPAAIVAGSTVLHLTVDHLGAPILATQSGGAVAWSGGLAPFGEDYANSSGAGIFLRFPGQVEDATWAGGLDEPYYNVYRWYAPGVGAFVRPDPEWKENLDIQPPEKLSTHFAYVDQRPTSSIDPFGLVPIDPKVSPKCRQAFDNDGEFKDFLRDVEEAANRARDAPPCQDNPGRPKKVKVKCGSCGGNCGRASPLGSICVNVSLINNGSCGLGKCLGSTAFHEFIHQCSRRLRDEAMAWGCEALFYGSECRFEIPPNFKRCPNPCARD